MFRSDTEWLDDIKNKRGNNMSETKTLQKITSTQITKNGVQALATRPNNSAQYGQGGLSSLELKLWFDKLATFLAGKINMRRA